MMRWLPLIGVFLAAPVWSADCEALLAVDGLLELPDAPTNLTAAASIEVDGGLPAHCRVQGYVAPQVGFELRLPTADWNGKLLMQGCGGLCGAISSAACDDALARGYAVVATDMGHQGPAFQSLWALDNLPAEIDFAYRATHVVTVAAKVLVEAFYGRAASRSYFRGCSTGGRQGLVEAQRFPEDFDGIIAGAPVLDETGTAALHLIWSGRANLDAQGRAILTPARVDAVRAQILAACDDIDGRRDGIIDDPRRCRWRRALNDCGTSELRVDCFSAAELQVLDYLYEGARTSTGRRLVPGGLMPGSEYEWVPYFVGRDGPAVFHPDGPIKQLYQALIFFRDPGPGHSAAEFDFDRDPPRLALMETLYSARNPDLRRFRERGGKLIIYQGWDDVEVTPLNIIDYFETVQRTMGGRESAREFARLFMMPGVAHCRRGPGADTVDWLGYLERWVEQGDAPDLVTAHHLAKEQTYLGLPRPRFPLPANAVAWTRNIAAYSGR
ncbi:MAG: tannase/feruloyl esterase family alpha/beta hydrolase [Gammaproteobacteria bacterium]|nr:tannase/feruloyl esterase family alpha/beta hydrolase [Gammaproteobacteria bacterium]